MENKLDCVKNNINSSNLKAFTIEGLFGCYDLTLDFEKEVNIYIGENGLGKTTILNCIYYVLTKNFRELSKIQFKTILVEFKDETEKYKLNKSDLKGTNGIYDRNYIYDGLFEKLLRRYSINEYMNFDEQDYGNIKNLVYHMSKEYGLPEALLMQSAKEFITMRNFDLNISKNISNTKGIKRIKELKKAISTYIDEEIIYLPTYRRIENNFSDIVYDEDYEEESEDLIKFGMADVQKSVDSILEQIRNIAVQGYNEMTGFLLEQYTQKSSLLDKKDIEIDGKIIEIVLNRLGDKVNSEIKENILKVIKSKEIYNKKYENLFYLLNKLTLSYQNQKHLDDKINNFVNTCNKYFNNKKFYYDPSELTLKILMNEHQDCKIDFIQLSSGEKQIVSLFSKLYLENSDDNIIIIDEPELSLSIIWQQMLIPDIMRSGSCKLLLAVTHSPFIFDNEFDLDAKEIRNQMTFL